MNERIEELFFQAGASTRTLSTIKTHTSFDPEKFAELIVRECAKIAGKAEYSDTWLEPVEDAIKKHFGVE
jgi:hypothetical protein